MFVFFSPALVLPIYPINYLCMYVVHSSKCTVQFIVPVPEQSTAVMPRRTKHLSAGFRTPDDVVFNDFCTADSEVAMSHWTTRPRGQPGRGRPTAQQIDKTTMTWILTLTTSVDVDWFELEMQWILLAKPDFNQSACVSLECIGYTPLWGCNVWGCTQNLEGVFTPLPGGG